MWLARGLRGSRGIKYQLEIIVYPPDRRRRDMDNVEASLKSAIDGFCQQIDIDDSQIVRTVKQKSAEVIKGGVVVLTLTPHV